MAETKRRLGRGLDNLLSSSRVADLAAATAAPASLQTSSHERIAEIPVSEINCNPHQPRQLWDHDRLHELAESIKTNGLVQPILVRAMGDGYQIIAGERRFRACQLAGRNTITAIVRIASEDEMIEWALVENIHRADLSPIERGQAYHQYIERSGMTQDQAAQKLGEDRSTIANYMRLLELSQPIRELVSNGGLSMGHARALLSLPTNQQREQLAHQTVKEGSSVRELERRIQILRQPATPKPQPHSDPHITDLEAELTRAVGSKVTIKTTGRKKHKGKIIIEFYSVDDFDRIQERLTAE